MHISQAEDKTKSIQLSLLLPLTLSRYILRKPGADIFQRKSFFLGFDDSPNTLNTIPSTLSKADQFFSYLKFVPARLAYPIMGCSSFSGSTQTQETAQAKFPETRSFSFHIAYDFQISASALRAFNILLVIHVIFLPFSTR